MVLSCFIVIVAARYRCRLSEGQAKRMQPEASVSKPALHRFRVSSGATMVPNPDAAQVFDLRNRLPWLPVWLTEILVFAQGLLLPRTAAFSYSFG